jgi:hypothetical protein
VEYTLPVELAHTSVGPEIDGVGNGLIVTSYCAVITAHNVAVMVSVTFTHPDEPVPQVTVIKLVPAPAVIVPPSMVQE